MIVKCVNTCVSRNECKWLYSNALNETQTKKEKEKRETKKNKKEKKEEEKSKKDNLEGKVDEA